MTTLRARDIEAAELSDWRLLLNALHTRFTTGGFAQGLALVNAIGAAAEEMNHHPDLDIRWRTVHVGLSTHDAGGVTQLDIEQAHRIDEIARQLGAT